MGVYLTCKKRKNYPNIHKDVCISLKCSDLTCKEIGGFIKEYQCNYKKGKNPKKVKSDPFLVAD